MWEERTHIQKTVHFCGANGDDWVLCKEKQESFYLMTASGYHAYWGTHRS